MIRRSRQRGGTIFCGAVPVIVGALPVAGLGQTTSDQDLMSMPLEDLTRVKVYSASRHPEEARKAPSSVSIITAEEIHSRAKLNGSVPTGRWGAGSVELLYVSALTDMRGTRVSPYLRPSVTFSTKPLWGGWQFSSSLYDATNRRWFSPGGPNDPEDQIQMDGRGRRFKAGYRLPPRGSGRNR